MTFDKYFDLITAEWLISEKGERGIDIKRVKIIKENNHGVTISKEGVPILFIPSEQWEELKRRI